MEWDRKTAGFSLYSREVDRFVTRSVVLAAVGALLLAGCSDPAHDPAEWAGAPWSLRDAQLPDDRPSIRAWFEGAEDPGTSTFPPSTIHKGTQVILLGTFGGGQAEVGAAWLVGDEIGQACDPSCITQLSGCDTCTAADMLRAVVAQRESVLASLDRSAETWFVAAATDVSDDAGSRSVIAQLWFGQPDGSWVFRIDAPNVDRVKLVAEALADAFPAGT